LRGNVDTRLRKLAAGDLDGIVLAAAGLNRLGIKHDGAVALDTDEFLPAIGQGALAIETRNDEAAALFSDYNDPATAAAVHAERAFLQRVGGSCRTPLAAHATLRDAQIDLRALIAAVDGSEVIRGKCAGSSTQATQLGISLADELLLRGGRAILAALAESADGG
ncbi:MAG TPA: hypothetical protein VMT89_17860, partial [Candidatus Acidoferrales bacterium]|nr:hypothetical protein [Candidatus Acidoferrales bacterium]